MKWFGRMFFGNAKRTCWSLAFLIAIGLTEKFITGAVGHMMNVLVTLAYVGISATIGQFIPTIVMFAVLYFAVRKLFGK